MRPLRAVTALASCLLSSMSLPAGSAMAQDAPEWNDPRTRELVRAAIDRRAVQLADTGLLSYTARAHGYLTFLAQLGEGFSLPPKLIKSDELMVEVYWAAPDRSKQHVVGRRDTLLLPTDINYHRDHLGVVQNNFPDIIRLGDGDEVRDVPHPLSERGLATYDYRITDSLAIRSADRAIDVMMVRVRPKDDRAAAAIGAVYIDRITGSVVRMTFSFTRAALRDRQLEDVSVILENGLVEGRFWLPRRQEIEIRRSASWMDFPVRGIIRGRWEICCVQANVAVPASTFVGPEITEAPRAQQREYPFEGTILEHLPAEVRALDAEEVRRVQEEARDLVRAGALLRARTTSPSARGLSDVVRVNRAEGLALGAGLTQRLGRGFAVSVGGRYGTADDYAKVRGHLEWRPTPAYAVTFGAYDDFAEAGDAREVSGIRNSLAAQEFGSDWSDPYGVRGTFARVERAREGHRLSFEFSRRDERALALHGRPTSGRYEPLILADAVRASRATLGWSLAGEPTSAARRWSASARRAATEARDDLTSETRRYLRASFDGEGRWAIGAGGELVARTIAVGVAGEEPTVQDRAYFGGPVSGPGFAFHSLTGRAGVGQRIEWQTRIPFVAINLGRFGRVPSSMVLAPWLHGAWVDASPGVNRFSPSAGLGVLAFFDLVRVDVGRTLRGDRWLFSLDLTRDLWPVL